jgi:hypothetical protein
MKVTAISGNCPYCFRNATSAIHKGDEEPLTGDLGICKGCGGTVVFDFTKRNVLRRPKVTEWDKINQNQEYRTLRSFYVQQRVA